MKFIKFSKEIVHPGLIGNIVYYGVKIREDFWKVPNPYVEQRGYFENTGESYSFGGFLHIMSGKFKDQILHDVKEQFPEPVVLKELPEGIDVDFFSNFGCSRQNWMDDHSDKRCFEIFLKDFLAERGFKLRS